MSIFVHRDRFDKIDKSADQALFNNKRVKFPFFLNKLGCFCTFISFYAPQNTLT